MTPRNLIIASALLVVLSGAVYWAKKHPESGTPAAETAPKLVTITDARSIELKKKDGATVALRRENNKWAIAAPEPLPADQDAVSGMTSALNPLTTDSVVVDKPSNLVQFGLDHPSLSVTVSDKAGKTSVIEFGDDVPAGSLVYAMRQGDPKVYAVSNSVRSSLDKTANDLRDKRLLTFDSDKLTRLQLAANKQTIEFGRNGQNEWQILEPKPYRADSFQVEELLRKLHDAKLDPANTPEARRAPALFAAGQAVATVRTTDAGGTQTLEVRKNKDDYFAKSSVVPGVFKVAADVGTGLNKSLDDFRNKKLFDFGFSDPTRLDVQSGGKDHNLQKSGSDWKLNGKTLDSTSIQALIDRLRDLSAKGFVDTGFGSPSLSVTVVSNDGKRTEKLEFARSGSGYIAKRENEPTLYSLDAQPVDDILKETGNLKPAAGKSK